MGTDAKIWIQSCSAEADAVWGVYQESVKRYARKIARPDTEIEFHGVTATFPGIDHLDSAQHLATLEVVRNAIQAERRDYAAFVMVSTIDAGHREVRELIDLPVVFITECAIHLASQLAGTFAFLTHNRAILRKMERMARGYGLGRRMVEGASLDLSYQDFRRMYEDPEPVLAAFSCEARKAIERGAEILLPAGNPVNMFLLDHKMRKIEGVPILDILGTAVKTAEMLMDLKHIGITRAPSPATVEQREGLRARYNSVR
ncbi:MAG: aspartate/glutamate racemase family protein [candidate division NC10 bacterium]